METSDRPRRSSPLNLTGAFELFGKSYQIVKKNFELFAVLSAIAALIALWDTLGRYVGDENEGGKWSNFAANFAFGSSTQNSFYQNAGGLLLFLLVPYIISVLMLMILSLRAAQGNRPTFRQIWRELVEKWLWLKLIGAFIAVGFITILGFILLIIPGIILLWRLFLTPYILIDQKTNIETAIRKSWRMTRGFAWPIYSVLLVDLLLGLTNIVPIFGPIISFILTTIYSVAPALRYEELKKLA